MSTFNKFMVASAPGHNILILRPPTGPITKADALLLAAYLVTTADDRVGADGGEFSKIVEALLNS